MLAYHGRLAALHDFNKLLPPFADVNKEHENCSMFFMTLGFYGLVQEYVATYDKILGSLVNPTTTSASFALLCILQKINTETHTLSAEENTVFASLSNNSGPSHEGVYKNHPKCDHCHCIGHTLDKCWKLRRKPSRSLNIP